MYFAQAEMFVMGDRRAVTYSKLSANRELSSCLKITALSKLAFVLSSLSMGEIRVSRFSGVNTAQFFEIAAAT